MQRISQTHRPYDLWQYPLLFVWGKAGCNFTFHQVHINTGKPKFIKNFPMFLNYWIQRKNQYNHLRLFKQLFNNNLIDNHAKIEAEIPTFTRKKTKNVQSWKLHTDWKQIMETLSTLEISLNIFPSIKWIRTWGKWKIYLFHILLWKICHEGI